MKKYLLILLLLGVLSSCNNNNDGDKFVKHCHGQFEINGKPYYFIGANFWYGAILGSIGQGGNRERLSKELDFMKANGIDNLRILVGADGLSDQEMRVMPTLQLAPGVYNDTIFDGLDYLLAEMYKRDMYAVLYLNNSWEWSGGYGQYMNWCGYDEAPAEAAQDWSIYVKYYAQYAECEQCHQLFLNHVKHVITRTNRYTGKAYINDPAIMSWQVGNEPRAFSSAAKPAFVQWLKTATALIRSLDPNHLISIGSEGSIGCELDMELYETIHNDPNVDYLTIHIWPKNWNWIDVTCLTTSLDTAFVLTNQYIQEHLAIAEKLNKALVIEEFGYPRDHHKYSLDDPTTARDKYYSNIFEQIAQSAADNGKLAGGNCWSWGGFGRASHEYWQAWDDYLGDPAQEEQGLNAVFNTDSTVTIIKAYADKIR